MQVERFIDATSTLVTKIDRSTVVEDKRTVNSSQTGCNANAHHNRPFPHLYARTRAHRHTCTPAHVHTFSNLGFYARKGWLRYVFMCQNISHHVTTKHSTSHRFI